MSLSYLKSFRYYLKKVVAEEIEFTLAGSYWGAISFSHMVDIAKSRKHIDSTRSKSRRS